MQTIRDRESLLRGYDRELVLASDDKARTTAIKAEIDRVRALPPHPVTEGGEPTPVERESARAHAYLEGLRKERGRSDRSRHAEIDGEIARVEAALKAGGPKTERARNVPTAERVTATPSD